MLLSSEDEVIDEWLDRLERHTKHRFTDEEARIISLGYSFLSEHRKEHTQAMDRIRKARADWEEDRNLLTLWNFLERDYFDWLMQHLVYFNFLLKIMKSVIVNHVTRFNHNLNRFMFDQSTV